MIATRSLDEWLELFDDEDVLCGACLTVDEAAAELRVGQLFEALPT